MVANSSLRFGIAHSTDPRWHHRILGTALHDAIMLSEICKADEDGKKTTDIGSAITGGRFRGFPLAYAAKGTTGNIVDTALLRCEATLTVTIPKTTGNGPIRGNLNNFEEWSDSAWNNFATNFNVALESTTILDGGEFSGITAATGRTDFNGGARNFKGAFYVPRSDSDNLEVAGSYTVGWSAPYSATHWNLLGSFGARQR